MQPLPPHRPLAVPHPLRPQYHVTPPTGWLNDPNGTIYLDGEYHLFYQWSPRLAVTDALDMHWAHAVSRNLVEWEDLPIALAPDALGAIWSGSAVYDRDNTSDLFSGQPAGGLVAIFTHHDVTTHAERQSLACSHDRGRTWTQFSGNPVLGDATTKDFRDPKVFWHAPTARWVMIVGCKHRLYTSPNLKTWTLSQELPYGSECPDLMELPIEGATDTRWVLNLGGREYVIGRFDGRTFTAESDKLTVDGGMDFYAPMSWNDLPPLTAADRAREGAPGAALEKTDRRALWIGWICNWKYAKTVPDFGARGVLTVPRELRLRPCPDGSFRLVQLPCRELSSAWHEKVEGFSTPSGGLDILESAADLTLNLRVGPDDVCGLEIFAPRAGAPDAPGVVRLGYDAPAQCWFLERQAMPGGIEAARFTCSASAQPAVVGREVSLRVLLDRCVLEAFFDDGSSVITSLIFPPAGACRTRWFSKNKTSQLLQGVVRIPG